MPTKTLKDVTVADAYLAILADRGVDYLFGNAGTDFAPLIESLSKAQTLGLPHPEPITVPHENTAQHMAIGYYLATGKPQLTMMHVNVGTANGMNGLLNASRGNIPMLFTAGRTPTNEDQLDGHRDNVIHWTQEMYDQNGMTREAAKWDYELRNGEQIETIVDRMLTMSMSDPKGPVYLSLPREVLAIKMKEYTYETPGRVQPTESSLPNPKSLDEAASILSKAKNPVIITNWGGRNPGVMPALVALADKYAIPVVEFGNRFIAMPNRHPMYAGGNPIPYVEAADAILVIDCAVPWLPAKVQPNEDCKVIQMANDPMYSMFPVRHIRSDISLACGTDLGLLALANAMGEPSKDAKDVIEARRKVVTAKHQKLEDNWAQKLEDVKNQTPVHPAWLSHCIAQVSDSDTIFSQESKLPPQYLPIEKPLHLMNAGASSGLGHGMGVALGYKLADRDKLVIGVHGDGAYMFNVPVSAHYVAAEQKLPILSVVMNNQKWQAVRGATLRMVPDGYASKANQMPLAHFTVEQHYEKLVEVSGGYGEQVTDPAKVMGAVERAHKAVTVEKRQALLNVMVTDPI
ncbi:MAG: thiamine pyrophosphate-requiring protein [Rhodospirillales bacterium]|jgi:acetolactate synthase I/II/III large subunit|nr:thiamine pyrophosphate-requiring protein [Rhodospirillales bacterium]MBT5075996.1 thiamine pyrophosphate-requiring protein [Rhodospirillales bacterium]MBT5112790.1 thiamine pyrophosphate-requiring protein [Rhodospirillales bacterium]MBT5673560.1 thiamine pyrophosphate-requiring protein [Rhodospirillales bacterium]MBT6186219.1 thiamine pyrophosphate-requiring protein [Rhodospirillales bacterium]